MIVLVPSYQPDHRLVDLLGDLSDQRVLVVDDGSGPGYQPWFDQAAQLGAVVVSHRVNRGKGQALRTGFAEIARRWPDESVVCADSDGQHTPADIAKVAEQLARSDADMVLGVRAFSGRVPWRSRIGNTLTAMLFKFATGLAVSDTQTGLRGYPARMLDWLGHIEGDRFEYELNALLAASRAQMTIDQVSIATVYLDENASSHFRPLQDSWLIYRPLLKFCGSSLLGFAVDCAALAVLLATTGSLVVSVVGARLISATVNYSVNRRYVFESGREMPVRQTLGGYVTLAAILLAANLALMSLLTGALGAFWSKIATELTLVAISYAVQRSWVFAKRRVAGHQPGRERTRSQTESLTV